MQNKTWTVKEILSWTSDYFNKKNVDAPRITSELLLGKALNLSRVKLYLEYDRPLTTSELKEFRAFIERRASGEPTQYITGCQEFWSLGFKVTPDVLIPRADTETLVESVTDDIRSSGRKSVSILEIGTGSGIISVSIAHEMKRETGIRIKALDISEKALAIARENAESNQVSDFIEFVTSDGFEAIKDDEMFDYIVSNPPYIAEEFYEGLESKVKDFEPKIALCGGVDGLTFYKDIFSRGFGHLKENGKIFVEIDFRKTDELAKIIDGSKYSGITYYRDISGHKRVLSISRS